MSESIEELKNKDLSPKMIEQMTKPKKTWFILRVGDGKIMAMEELEAWNTLTNKSNWVRHDFKIVGCSDGTTFARIINESKKKASLLLEEIKKIEAESNKYRKTEEKFVFEDLLDIDDEKVKKVRDIINKYDIELEKKNVEYLSISKNVAQTAFEAELEVAKNNQKVFPSNQNILTPGVNDQERERVLKLMGQ